MAIRAYRTQAFNTTHENLIFDALLKELEQNWIDSEEVVLLLGNFYCNGNEIDAAIIKRNSITVIDFKNYEGHITFSENGQWFANGVEVKGGSKKNPYLQIRDNKFALLKFLTQKVNLPSGREQNFGHISGLALFHRPIAFNQQELPQSIKPWFHVYDIDNVLSLIAALTSSEINLSNQDLEEIILALNIPEYFPIRQNNKAITPLEKDNDILKTKLTDSLDSAFFQICNFLNSEERIFTVTGMIGTGIEQLLQSIIDKATFIGRNYTILAPNRRISLRYSAQESVSVYTHIYSGNPKMKKDKITFDILENQDTQNHLYIVVDAHLISDSSSETDIRCHGSGQLLSDLCSFIDLENSDRQIIFLGDPFQLTRGKVSESALCSERLTAITGFSVDKITLDLITKQPNNLFLENALGITQSINNGIFNQLNITTDDVQCIKIPDAKDDKRKLVESLFINPLQFAKFVAYSHKQVNQLNDWIRQKIFKRSKDISRGDIVHIHNSFFGKVTDDSENPIYVPSDSFAEVLEVWENIESLAQMLKGREKPVIVDFIRLRVRLLSNGKEVQFLCLKDYLYSEKPEIHKDSIIALFVSAKTRFYQQKKYHNHNLEGMESSDDEHSSDLATFLQSDPWLNAAQLRFGYALTLHRAQGQQFDTIIANMDTEQGRTNESYFRWVYTMFSIVKTQLILSNIPQITPFYSAIWNDSVAKLGSVNFSNLIAFDPNAEASPTNTVDCSIPQLELRNLYLHIAANLNDQGISIKSRKGHKYQEVYSFERQDNKASCSLRLYYNGKFQVTRIEAIDSKPTEFGNQVIDIITSDVNLKTDFQKAVYKSIRNQLEPQKLIIKAIEHYEFQEIYYIKAEIGEIKLQIFYDGEDFVTRISPMIYSTTQILETVHSALSPLFQQPHQVT